MSFYIDSATGGEVGQARSQLNLTGNTSRLKDNEFHFVSIKGHDDPRRVTSAIDELSKTDGISPAKAKMVAERVEGLMLEPKGLVTLSEAYTAFYAELRASESTALKNIVASKLHRLGAKPKGLHLTVEEFVPEDFRVHSNLTTRFELSPQSARRVLLKSLLELLSVYSRTAHMREFNCIVGMEEDEEQAWNLKADSLYRAFAHEPHARQRQFMRVAKIAGLGEGRLKETGKIDLDRLMQLRRSDELAVFRTWLRSSESKTDKEIRDRVASLRSKFGNFLLNTTTGKGLRILLTNFSGFIPNPAISIPLGFALGSLDSFLLERLWPQDAVISVLVKEYPAICKNGL
jgi:hypothetical protein